MYFRFIFRRNSFSFCIRSPDTSRGGGGGSGGWKVTVVDGYKHSKEKKIQTQPSKEAERSPAWPTEAGEG